MIYSCGHDMYGNPAHPDFWKLLPRQRMPMSSGLCTTCVRHNGPCLSPKGEEEVLQ